MRQRLFTFNIRLLMAALCVLMVSSFSVSSVHAQAHEVGYYPNSDQTCKNIVNISTIAGIGLSGVGTITYVLPNPVTAAIGGMGVTLDLIAFAANGLCTDLDKGIRDKFVQAYDEAVSHGVRPGAASNDVHYWVGGIMIQDFTGVEDSSGNQIGDGWGAIIMDGAKGSDPHFVYGSTWVAYKRAVYEKSVLGGGIDPGYPTSFQHQWNRVVIQDFSGGSWGITAIIGGDQQYAWLVAGNHLQAYIDADGSNTLGNPLGPVELNADKWYEQKFEGGKILELAGKTKVEYYNASDTPSELPAAGQEQATQPVAPATVASQPTSPPVQPTEPSSSEQGAPTAAPTSPPIDLSQFQAGCHYFWSDQGNWVANNCDIGVTSSSPELGPPLDAPMQNGCDYYFDGSHFYQNTNYGC